MLVNFRVENFKSFKNENNINMYASKINDKLETHTISSENEKNRLLKSAVIFGPNASGKSNLIQAMSFMRKYVEMSANIGQAKENLASEIEPFILNSETENKPSSFEVTFIIDNIRYRYGFTVDQNRVWNEWLFHKISIKETPLFIRSEQNIEYINTAFSEGKLIKKENKTRENVLFLSVVAQFNGKISLKIFEWFEKLNVTSNVGRNKFEHYTLDMLSNDDDREKISKLVKAVDVGIYNIIKVDKVIEFDELPSYIKEQHKEKKISDIKRTTIETEHIKYGQEKKYLDSVNFNLRQESVGTQKFIMLAGPIIETLEKGEILIVDELDNSFHTMMTKFIVKLFHTPSINKKNAQLIFITHDTNILNQDCFRRDQIVFAEKNLFGESNLIPLLDFGIRKDVSLEKNYLEGKYGGIPHISSDIEMIFSSDDEGQDNGF